MISRVGKYIGVHKMSKRDSYLGSGRLLHQAIQKYGRENFERVTLFTFDNSTDAYLKESEIVNEEFVSKRDNYNMKIGGVGGFTKENGQRLVGKFGKEHPSSKPRSLKTRKRISESRKGITFSDEHRSKLAAAKIGSKASLETKLKMSNSSTRPSAKKIEYLGQTYNSIIEAERMTKVSRHLLLKHGSLA